VPFRSTALATGTVTWSTISAPQSITIPSGATLGTSNGVPFRIWIFENYNGGAPELGVATCSSPTTIFACAAWESTLVTSTAISGSATAPGTLYATAGVTLDAVRIIGYCDFSAGLATAGSYTSACTTLQLFGPGVKKPGESVQVVAPQFGTLAVVTFTSLTASNVTASIALTSPINLVKYFAQTTGGNASDGNSTLGQMYRGSTAIGSLSRASTAASNVVSGGTLILSGYDQPATASSTTYVIKGTTTASTTGSIPAVNTDSATEILEEIMG